MDERHAELISMLPPDKRLRSLFEWWSRWSVDLWQGYILVLESSFVLGVTYMNVFGLDCLMCVGTLEVGKCDMCHLQRTPGA
jgi:hypothetical protein